MIARWTRPWFGLTAAIVLVGLVIQGVDVWTFAAGHFRHGAALLNMFFYFTIESNIILMVTCALLAWRPTGWGTTLATFRTAGLVGIVITGIVYYAVLKDLLDLHGWAYVSDLILHTVSPLMAAAGWLVFGPRRYAGTRATWLSVLFPALYLLVTLVRGPIVSWYPYPFVDVITHGYATVAVNCVLVAVLFCVVAFGASWLDRILARGSG
jgi:hypothetical protein